jgi:hypothetical protein
LGDEFSVCFNDVFYTAGDLELLELAPRVKQRYDVGCCGEGAFIVKQLDAEGFVKFVSGILEKVCGASLGSG